MMPLDEPGPILDAARLIFITTTVYTLKYIANTKNKKTKKRAGFKLNERLTLARPEKPGLKKQVSCPFASVFVETPLKIEVII